MNQGSILRTVRYATVGIVALAALLAYWAALQFVEAKEARARMANVSKMQITDQQSASGKMHDQEQQHWKALRIERSFNWEAVFGVIELAHNSEVALTDFQPDRQADTIVLRGEVRNRQALVDYVDLLRGQNVIADAYLVQQSVRKEGPETYPFEIKLELRLEVPPSLNTEITPS
jgi:hypothetical protein